MLHRERARNERSRLAYVALTRARLSLHLYLHPKVRDEQGTTIFSADSRSLLDNLWEAIGFDIPSLPVIGAAPDCAPADAVPAFPQVRQRLVRRFERPPPPPDVSAIAERVSMATEEGDITFSWVRQTARRVGTVVHEVLERFGRSGPIPLSEIPHLRARIESRLEALGVEAAAARAGADRALLALRATLEDARGRWLFDRAHRDAHSELALSGVRGAEIVNAVIDRTFVDADGIRWIVDFKTSPHEGGDLEGFLASEALRYEAQLRRYAHLARELGPEPVRAGLYFPLLAAWREVDVG
jgi:ATP-dependent exoDNAse (exonuclease V) beta subunit